MKNREPLKRAKRMMGNREALKLADRMHYHVVSRGGAKLQNGAWDMMLEASSTIKRLVARQSKQKPKMVATLPPFRKR